MNRLPPDAFEYYISLGPDRSYDAVAQHFGVSKKSVTNRAVAEDWQKRHAEIEQRAKQRSEDQLVESLEQMNVRHLKTLQVIQRKGLEALKSYPLTTAMEAVRAIDVSIRQERLIRGEPSERVATNVEDVIRREYNRWLAQDQEEEASAAVVDPRADEEEDDG